MPDDLKFEAETNRDDRINFEQRQTVVNFCLLRVNLTLDDGVACDWAAIDARGIANVPSQIQCRLRRSLECNADFKRNAKALAAARNQIAPAYRHRRGGTSEVDLPAARNRRCGITEESFASQGKAPAAGHRGGPCNGIANVSEHPGADVKAARQGKEIKMRFDGLESQLAVVGDAVFAEAAGVADHIEAGAHVGAVRHSGCDFRPSA